jgi:antiphage defense system Thoeris ThsB-like protein
MATRVFTAFDYDHDEFLRTALAGQSKNEDSPFEICDYSVKEPFTGDWKKKVRERIKKCGQMIVICGEHTHEATGVATELTIAQEEELPYFLLWGYADKSCYKPTSAKDTDKIYKWTWDNLKKLIKGDR